MNLLKGYLTIQLKKVCLIFDRCKCSIKPGFVHGDAGIPDIGRIFRVQVIKVALACDFLTAVL